MPKKEKTVILTIELRTTMRVKDFTRANVQKALASYLPNDPEYGEKLAVQQVKAQVAQ